MSIVFQLHYVNLCIYFVYLDPGERGLAASDPTHSNVYLCLDVIEDKNYK